MRRRAANGGGAAMPHTAYNEGPGTPGYQDMQAQLAALHARTWGRN